MKKKLLIVLLCIAVVIIGIAILARYFAPAKIDISRSGPSASAGGPPRVVDRTFTENTAAYSVQVEYPELQGLADSGIQDRVDRAIKAFVYDQIAGFHTGNASSSVPIDASGTPSNEGNPQQSTLNANFTVALLTKSFFSGMMTYSDYSAGAAHSDNYLMTLNYNLKTGDAVTIAQILQELDPADNRLSTFGKIVRQKLVEQFGTDSEATDAIQAGAASTLENYQHFTLDRQGLNVLFNPYEVGPGSAGMPQVSIAYGDLMKGATATSSVLWWLQ